MKHRELQNDLMYGLISDATVLKLQICDAMFTGAIRLILSLLTFCDLTFSGCYKAVQYYWL